MAGESIERRKALAHEINEAIIRHAGQIAAEVIESVCRERAAQIGRRAAKDERREAEREIERWLAEQGAVESCTFEEDTGRPMRTFTIDLTKEK